MSKFKQLSSGFVRQPIDVRVFGVLGLALAVSAAFHVYTGPEELHRNHIELGRYLLYGERAVVATHPMLGYSLLIAALGKWTPVLNALLGFGAFVAAYRSMDLGRAPPTLGLYMGLLAYAGMAASFNDHSVWGSLLLLALAIVQKYGALNAATGAATGLMFGLAYNVRSEVLMLFPIFTAAHLAHDRIMLGRWRLRHHAAAVAVLLVAMLPWALWMKSQTGRYSPTTTYGWTLAYYSLGIVKSNRYGIVPQDEYAEQKAAEMGEPSAWSARVNDHFKREYLKTVTSDPELLARRIVTGLYYVLRLGVYTPDFRQVMTTSKEHFERVRLALGNRGSSSWGDLALAYAYYFAGQIPFMLVMLLLLLQLRHPSRLMAVGPAAAFAAAMLAHVLIVGAIVLPISRLNSVLIIFVALVLQRASALGGNRRHWFTRQVAGRGLLNRQLAERA